MSQSPKRAKAQLNTKAMDSESMASAPKSRTATPAQTAAVLLVGALILIALAIPYTDWAREGKYAKMSLSGLETEKTAHGGDPILLYWLGQRLNESSRFAEATEVLGPAVDMEPNSARLRDAWAEAQLATGQAGPAFSQLKQFTTLRPNDPQAHLLLGKLHVTLGADVLAEPALKEAVRLNPNLAEAWLMLGEIQVRADREDDAVAPLRRAIALNPNHAAAHVTLAKVLATRDPKAAEESFRTAVKLEPGNAAFHREFAGFLARYARNEEAEKEAQEALRLNPNDARANMILGRCRMERNALDEAQAPLEQAAALEPYDPLAAQALQQLFEKKNDTAKAAEWGKQYTQRRRVAEEGRRLRDALMKTPKDKDLNLQMARYQARLGKIEDCIHYMAIAISAPLDSPPVLTAAIRELRAAGRTAEADALERQMLKPNQGR